MVKAKAIDLAEIEKYYTIEEDGSVFSKVKGRYMSQFANTAGYFYVSIPLYKNGMFSAHRLVAAKYIGQCPIGKEVSHKDGNKRNNHYTNLEYLSHSENMLKSFREHGRVIDPYERGPVSWETKQLMGLSKSKAVVDSNGNKYRSIDEASKTFGISRRTIYRAIYGLKAVKKTGIKFRFV